MQINQVPHSKQVLGSLEGLQCGDRPILPGTAAVPDGPGGLEGSAGWLQMVGAGGGRAAAGTMVGLCGAARHSLARLGAAPCASSWALPCTSGAESGHGSVPRVPTGDRGAASGKPGWLCPAAAVGARGGLCSQLCSHQPWSEETATAGGSEPLAPSLGSRVGPAGSCLLEPAGEGWFTQLAAEEDVSCWRWPPRRVSSQHPPHFGTWIPLSCAMGLWATP